MQVIDFKKELEDRTGITLNDNYILFNDYELFNEDTQESVIFHSFDEVLNYKIDDKTIKEIIEEKADATEIDFGGRGSSSSSSKGNLFDGKGERKAGKGKGEAMRPLPPAYINTLTSARYKSVEKTSKAFGKNFIDADREYAGVIDKDGFALEYTKGNRTSVQHLERPNAYSIHNHPSKYINEKGKGRVIAYNAPSSADLRNWALGRGKGTIVVASGNRTMYIMSKSNNFKGKEFTKAMKSAKTTGKYDSDVDKWLRANQKKFNYKYSRSKF